jgi:hypothetical protein
MSLSSSPPAGLAHLVLAHLGGTLHISRVRIARDKVVGGLGLGRNVHDQLWCFVGEHALASELGALLLIHVDNLHAAVCCFALHKRQTG